VVGRRRHVVYVQAEQDGWNNSTLSYAGPHATSSGCGCLEGRFERPTMQVRWYGFNKVRGKIKDCEFVEETFDPYSVEGLSHI
jgi:hypothetical protein